MVLISERTKKLSIFPSLLIDSAIGLVVESRFSVPGYNLAIKVVEVSWLVKFSARPRVKAPVAHSDRASAF